MLFAAQVVPDFEVDRLILERTSSPVVLYIFGQVQECFLNVATTLGAYLQKQHVMLLRQFSSLLLQHLPLLLEIALRSDQYFADRLARVALYLFDPPADVLEALFVVDGVSEDDAGCTLVVCLGDIPEAFLPCCIPDL